MKKVNIDAIVRILKKETKNMRDPVVTQFSWTRSPFKVLISCLLSLRAKDEVTGPVSEQLFKVADTPEKLSRMTLPRIEKIIYKTGFYKNKARVIKDVSKKLVDAYDSKVPDTIDELLTFKGVGRKTANLVVTLGYGKPGICVDTHVHRISNRLGYVKTKMADETEMVLRDKLPRKYWIIYNDLLVMWGQNICAPISPWCSKCAIAKYCNKVGVEKNR